nr:glutamyl aminopeptidase-like [Penaeus vannamei]
MPVKNEVAGQPSESLTEVTFDKSVPMVTYLVCFIVCDFTYKETILSSGMPFRVYAPNGRIENSQYALDIGAKILQMYEGMFDLLFPLPKSDMAAIPDYSSGATEHWGIITFRETSIFYNQNQSSAVNKQRVASVVAHELAHQWFGNLVTLEWWNDLWLNEGFASYVEFKGVDHVHPEWEMDSQFLGKNLQLVMKIDSRLSSHPIVKNVNTPDQINAMFDAISYRKGSSVLRMLEDFMEILFKTSNRIPRFGNPCTNIVTTTVTVRSTFLSDAKPSEKPKLQLRLTMSGNSAVDFGIETLPVNRQEIIQRDLDCGRDHATVANDTDELR